MKIANRNIDIRPTFRQRLKTTIITLGVEVLVRGCQIELRYPRLSDFMCSIGEVIFANAYHGSIEEIEDALIFSEDEIPDKEFSPGAVEVRRRRADFVELPEP